MKMLYVYVGGGMKHTSVQSKIVTKIRFFNENGMDTHGVFFSLQVDKEHDVNDRIKLIPVKKPTGKYFQGIAKQKNSILTAMNYIERHINEYDVIYMRYPTSSYWLYKGIKKIGHKVVFEHNTKDLDEAIMRAKSNPFGWSPTSILTWLQDNKYIIWVEKFWAPKVLKYTKFGLANTHEIVQYKKDMAIGDYKCELITNGVDLTKIAMRPPVQYDGKNLSLFLMRGAQGVVPYDGTDRLLKGMSNYTGDVNVTLYFIGAQFPEEERMVRELGLQDNVNFTGKLIGDDLTNAIESFHLSIGTMAIHRKSQREGSVLRVNESLCRGIPVVVAYEDMELNSDEGFKPYYLKLAPDDSVINIEDICQFASSVYSIPNNNEKIRALAEKHIDYNIKISKSIEYIKEVFS